MPIYPMICSFSSCGAAWELNTSAYLYMQSKKDGFRDTQCGTCGQVATSKRWWPADGAPKDITPRGWWGRTATPGLKGKKFYGKEERDRQTAHVGTHVHDDGDDPSPRKGKVGKVIKVDADGEIIHVDKRTGLFEKPSETVLRWAVKENDGIVSYRDVVASTKLTGGQARGAISYLSRSGALEATGQPREYRVVTVSA